MQPVDKPRAWAKVAVRRIIQWPYCLCQLHGRGWVCQYRSASRRQVGWSWMGFPGNQGFSFFDQKYNFMLHLLFYNISIHWWGCLPDEFIISCDNDLKDNSWYFNCFLNAHWIFIDCFSSGMHRNGDAILLWWSQWLFWASSLELWGICRRLLSKMGSIPSSTDGTKNIRGEGIISSKQHCFQVKLHIQVKV